MPTDALIPNQLPCCLRTRSLQMWLPATRCIQGDLPSSIYQCLVNCSRSIGFLLVYKLSQVWDMCFETSNVLCFGRGLWSRWCMLPKVMTRQKYFGWIPRSSLTPRNYVCLRMVLPNQWPLSGLRGYSYSARHQILKRPWHADYLQY